MVLTRNDNYESIIDLSGLNVSFEGWYSRKKAKFLFGSKKISSYFNTPPCDTLSNVPP